MTNSELETLIERLTLLNAYSYNGKPNEKAVIGSLLGSNPVYRSKVKEIKVLIENKTKEISKLSIDEIKAIIDQKYPEIIKQIEQKAHRQKDHIKSLPKLENAKKNEVILRLPPEPSGYLHIGHAYAGYINFLYKKMYDGKLILRFEDTNPSKVEMEYYDAIKEAYKYLGIEYDEIIYESDHISFYYQNCVQLIQGGNAYVCFCPVEIARSNRSNRLACEHRNQDSEINLKYWKEMLVNMEEGKAVVRLKGDLSSDRETLRDPTIFRIVTQSHPRIGDKYRVYPLYDFAVSIEDAQVTHVLRSEEFIPKIPLQNLIRSYLGLKNPTYTHFSRLKIKNTPVQKRVIRSLIKTGHIDSWSDPRLSTVFGLKSRGILPETLIDLVYERNLSTSQSEIDWNILLAINRKIMDPKVRRLFAVLKPLELIIEDNKEEVVKLKNHPIDKSFGKRTINVKKHFWIDYDDFSIIKSHEIVRLKDYKNIKIKSIDNNVIMAENCYSENKSVPKIQWVPKELAIPMKLRKINELYLNLKENELNPNSMEIEDGFIENTINEFKKFDVIQLERIGFVSISSISNKEVILNLN